MTRPASASASPSPKTGLRLSARTVRDGLPAQQRADASVDIAARFMASPQLLVMARQGVTAAWWPIRSEVDPMPLLEALAAIGVATALPVVAHPTLVFRLWRPGDALVDAGFGTRGPDASAPECAPRLVLAPCLAFDRAGGRLGYGAGHYDRALARLRALAPLRVAALAFSAQEVTDVFSESHDQPLDAIVTERELIWPGAAAVPPA